MLASIALKMMLVIGLLITQCLYLEHVDITFPESQTKVNVRSCIHCPTTVSFLLFFCVYFGEAHHFVTNVILPSQTLVCNILIFYLQLNCKFWWLCISSMAVEWTVAQTVEAVQMWSVELDPSRRRRESLQYFSSRPSPWSTRLAVCSFPSQGHVSIAEESRWQLSSMSVDHSENTLQSDVEKPSTSSSLKFVSPHQQGNELLETPEGMCLQTPATDHGERNLRTEEPVRFLDFRASSASDHVSADELAKEDHQKSIRTQMDIPGDSEAILDSRRLSWSQAAPGSSHPCPEEPAETLNEKTSESSLESPTPQTAEQFRGDDCVDAATPSMEPITPIPVGTSPTPPTNPLSVYGFPYRRADREGVGRKWLGFCSPPCTLSDVGVETMQIQKAESAPVHPPMSFEAEMSIQLQQVRFHLCFCGMPLVVASVGVYSNCPIISAL